MINESAPIFQLMNCVGNSSQVADVLFRMQIWYPWELHLYLPNLRTFSRCVFLLPIQIELSAVFWTELVYLFKDDKQGSSHAASLSVEWSVFPKLCRSINSSHRDKVLNSSRKHFDRGTASSWVKVQWNLSAWLANRIEHSNPLVIFLVDMFLLSLFWTSEAYPSKPPPTKKKTERNG